MGDSSLFVEKCPCGYTVTLSSEQFSNHIIGQSGHSITVDDIQNSILRPQIVYNSTTEAPRMVYFSKGCNGHPQLYVKTVTEIDDENEKISHVVTAFPAKEVKGKIDVEKGPMYVNITNQI